MGQGYFYVSNKLLESMLRLPDDAEITSVCAGPAYRPDVFAVYVKHPDLVEGEQCDPWYTSTLEDGEHYVPGFCGWFSSERFRIDAPDPRP